MHTELAHERMERGPRFFIAGLCIAVLLWNGYRACTLSITHDEAFTYLWYVAKGPRAIFSPSGYIANNHFLYSILAWISVQTFGVSEWSLRLPSVIAGATLVPLAARLFRLLTGSAWLGELGVCVLVLNPLVLDFATAARGYSLALAFSLWTWWHLGQALHSASARPHLLRAGAGMGLSVASNLAFLYPHAALGTVFLILQWSLARESRWQALAASALRLVIPAATLTAALCYPAFRHVNGDRFYFGSESLFEFARSLVQPAVEAAPGRAWLCAGHACLDLLAMTVLGLAAAALLPLPYAIYRLLRDPTPEPGVRPALYVLLAGGTLVLVGLHVLSHALKGTPYPRDRTGLYFLPLLIACGLHVVQMIRPASRWLARGLIVFGCLVVAHFTTQLQADFLYPWRYDAGTRRIYQELSARAADGPSPMQVEHTWLFEPSIDFYRAIYGPSNWRSCAPGTSAAIDFYLLDAPSARVSLPQMGLRTVHVDPISGVVIAAPSSQDGQ